MKRKIMYLVFGLVVLGAAYYMYTKAEKRELRKQDKVSVSVEEKEVFAYMRENLNFSEIETDFIHKLNDNRFYFQGGAVVDLDNDGKDEVYVTGGEGQGDFYFVYENGTVVNKIDELIDNNRKDAGSGVTAVDIDNNGKVDLIVTKQTGLYIHYNTEDGFVTEKIDVVFEKNAIPVDIATGDIDNDGDLDMYVSTFVDAGSFKVATFNDPSNSQRNIMLRNEGDRIFKDVTKEVGLELKRNTFVSSFVDLDDNENIDLVVATNTGKVQIYENTGGSFVLKSEPTGFGFWMGLAVTDFDFDGDQDFIFSNAGTTIPERLLKGDIREDQVLGKDYAVIINNGDFSFENKTPQIFLEQPFGWGVVAHDFDNDNKDDFLVSQNYIKWPGHKLKKNPGSIISVNSDSGLYEDIIDGTGLENKNFNFTSLVADLNGDREDDVVYLNIDGKTRFLLGSESKNNKVVILLPENSKYQEAKFEISIDGQKVSKRYNSKQGIQTDQKSAVYFSLGNREEANLSVSLLNGDIENYTLSILNPILDLR